MKKLIGLSLVLVIILLALTGCETNTLSKESKEITVVSREEGSGTRGAFIELFEIEVKGEDGTKVDHTTKEAVTTSKTDVMLTTIANDTNGIGYVSLGSLNSSVKALNIDGIKATEANIKDGSYKISRPFILATKVEVTEVTQDFIDFILSKEGQEVIGKDYIAIDEKAPSYIGEKPSGRIVVVGSSSVSPIMEKLKEAYLKINTNASIEIQTLDSSAGITATIDETCDIGMSSRELKDSEKEKVTGIQIAIDGIAVIVNNKNNLTNLAKEEVKEIFTGKILNWDEI